MNAPAPRPAVVTDADELTRLHIEAGIKRPVDDAWLSTHRDNLVRRLTKADTDLVAFVIDKPTATGLAAAVVGFLRYGICRPGNAAGLTAHIGSVTTMPGYRKRGYARAAVSAFLTEAKRRGCAKVSLYTSDEAAHLYQSLGFARLSNAMSLDLEER